MVLIGVFLIVGGVAVIHMYLIPAMEERQRPSGQSITAAEERAALHWFDDRTKETTKSSEHDGARQAG